MIRPALAVAALSAAALVGLAQPARAQAPAAPAPPAATTPAPAPVVLTVVTETVPDLIKGQAYSTSLQATAGKLPYKWAIVGGGLPPGVTLNNETGAILGKCADVGTFYATIRVTDAATPRAKALKTLQFNVLKKAAPPTAPLPAPK